MQRVLDDGPRVDRGGDHPGLYYHRDGPRTVRGGADGVSGGDTRCGLEWYEHAATRFRAVLLCVQCTPRFSLACSFLLTGALDAIFFLKNCHRCSFHGGHA